MEQDLKEKDETIAQLRLALSQEQENARQLINTTGALTSQLSEITLHLLPPAQDPEKLTFLERLTGRRKTRV